MKVERISTEVVVVGGGGAGLMAALEARKNGSEVLLLAKTVLGGGSCTTLSLGSFRVADTPEGREEHLEQTIAAGKNLNDLKLLRILVGQAFDRVKALEEYGVPIIHEPPFIHVMGKAPFYGMTITSSLQKVAKELGITSMGQIAAIDLLKADDTVCGLLAYSPNRDMLIIIEARAVVLATGGAGGLYPLHDNSPRTTGDGFGIAARAGAVMRDMEFVQFYPLGLLEGGLFRCIVPPWLADWGPIRNALGEDILAKYGIKERPAAVKARDALSQAMFREIVSGRGFGCCLEIDIRKIEDKQWALNNQLLNYKPVLQAKYPGLERPLRIAPVCHHFMGGVVIDEECRSSLPGLFAAGEVTGGIHGANRMGGNALSECVVFGALAGKHAAIYARRPKGHGMIANGVVEKTKEQMGAWRKVPPHPGASRREMRERLAKIMFDKVGIIRRGDHLEEANKEVHTLSTEIGTKMCCDSPRDVMRAIELRNRIMTAQMVIRGAILREESRGSHYREDFPETHGT